MKFSQVLLFIISVELLVATQTFSISLHRIVEQNQERHQFHNQQNSHPHLHQKLMPFHRSNSRNDTILQELATTSEKRALPLGAGCRGWGPGCAAGRAGARREAALGGGWRRRQRPTFHYSLVSNRRWHHMGRKRASFSDGPSEELPKELLRLRP